MGTEEKQLGALGFCAFTVPAVLILPSMGWLGAAIAAAVGLGLTALLFRLRGEGEIFSGGGRGKNFLLWGLFFWTLFVIGAGARQLCAIFPDSRATPLIGLLLLLLAVYSSAKRRSFPVAAICFFFLLGLYGLFFALSLPNLRGQYLVPHAPNGWLPLTSALLPVNLLFIKKGKKKKFFPYLAGAGIFTLLAATVTQGALSYPVAAENPFPFYEAAKSVSFLRSIRRPEPLVSAGLTLGGFCLLSLLCAVAEKLSASLFSSWKKLSPLKIFLGGSLGFYLSGLLGGTFIALGTTIFWGFLPFLILLVEKQKNIKKI